MNQNLWIGIAIGAFFVGLGIGITALQPVYPPMMTNNQMQQMINDPQAMNQWHQQMINDPQAMNQWMNNMMHDSKAMEQFHKMMIENPDHMRQMMSNPAMQRWMSSPEHAQQMTELMKGNHDFMQGIMMEMINDSDMRLQMLGHMSENPEAMTQMRMMVNGTSQMESHMSQNMRDP